jgi:pteridine reductase
LTSYESKVVLVTGGARRIGAEICRQLHARGYDIALHYNRSAEDARALAAELNTKREGSCRIFQAELNDGAQCGQLVEDVLAAFDGIKALINNASAYFPTPLSEPTDAAWDELLDTNLKAPYLLAQAARHSLSEHRGCVVNVLDAHASKPTRNYAIYNLSKSALADLTQSLALEYSPEVRVNGVAPGAILWPEDPDFGEQQQQTMLEKIPLASLGTCQDVAAAVVFLTMDAPYITGQMLAVDGGRALT